MSKFNVKDLNCFKQVAEIIGEAQAKVELYKVMTCGEDITEGGDFILEDAVDLEDSFSWSVAPQGFDLWDSINAEINPYEEEK